MTVLLRVQVRGKIPASPLAFQSMSLILYYVTPSTHVNVFSQVLSILTSPYENIMRMLPIPGENVTVR